MRVMTRTRRYLGASLALSLLAAASAFGTASARAESVFESPLDPGTCGERLMLLYDGDFDQFWNYVSTQGFSGVPEYAWSTPDLPGETPEEWRKRALQCMLEVERANQLDDTPEVKYALGYFLWFGTASVGFDKEADGSPGIRERGYNLLRDASAAGNRQATNALIQAYVQIVQLGDRQMAYGGRSGNPVTLPNWWPERNAILISLDHLAKSGYTDAYLAISAVYSERALLVVETHHDHNGNRATTPDPRLIEASRAYRKAWEDRRSQSPAS